MQYLDNSPSIIIVDSECHLIGGYATNKHYIWKNKESKLEEIYEFKSHPDGFHPEVIYIKSINKILSFGGMTMMRI